MATENYITPAQRVVRRMKVTAIVVGWLIFCFFVTSLLPAGFHVDGNTDGSTAASMISAALFTGPFFYILWRGDRERTRPAREKSAAESAASNAEFDANEKNPDWWRAQAGEHEQAALDYIERGRDDLAPDSRRVRDMLLGVARRVEIRAEIKLLQAEYDATEMPS